MEGRFHTDGAEQTEALGARLAASLGDGELVLVEGELGAGKTTFVRGAARALGVAVPVTSPTFTIGQRYPATDGRTVAHVDLYRLATLEEEDPELLADYLGPETIAFVEWPRGSEQALAALARPVARVRLEHNGGDRRTVTIA
ncbi:MAG: tRNA (adenosine(37)-N6)-threonylcarbamoyltransferase complex ATPase subunit type 1 TsaE [Solirubrobacteraceae bacterium]